jgi:hypothetical protein
MLLEPALPPVDELIAVSKAIAMLDAVLCPEWQYRYHSFNSKWAPGSQMGSMRDGCGDHYFILFNQHGAILKGYDHESPAAGHVIEHGVPFPGMYAGIPEESAEFLKEPAFSINETTFCRWRRLEDPHWQAGHPDYPTEHDPSGAQGLLTILQGDPGFYAEWARNYYEVPVDLEAVQRVYRHEPLSAPLVHALNPGVSLADLEADIEEIAYRP